MNQTTENVTSPAADAPQTSAVAAAPPSPPQPRPDPLWEATRMDGRSGEYQAIQAILHTLGRIQENPVVGYHMNLGSQAFALLTEALATLTGRPVREVREEFVCEDAVRVDPKDGPRLDWLQVQMLGLPSAYGDLIGLPGNGCDLREKIDQARVRG